jgi:hypothetical protein
VASAWHPKILHMGSVVPGFALRMVPNPGYKLRYG